MPLNSTPPVLDGTAFDAKRVAAEAQSVTDFAIWGGLTPLNLDRLPELHERGVIGFKAFMSDSGVADFPRADTSTLREAMRVIAGLDSLVAVHAESEEMTQRLSVEARATGGNGIREYLDSRPIAAELEAIRLACELAGEAECALHVVHVSSADGVALVRDFRARGVQVTCETCPHYLILSEDDLFGLGAVAKCAPPLRTAAQREQLLDCVLHAEVDTIGSDHSPSPPGLKAREDFFAVWGGIAGAQHLLPLMLDVWLRQARPDWPLLSRLMATNVARRFKLPATVGRIAERAEANLALVDLAQTDEISIERLHYRHRITPYAGRKLRGRVVRTLLRGKTIARDGQTTGAPAGRLVVPLSA
jgi:allantoinase